MSFVGLSFAMIERGNRQWWLMPVLGVLTLVITLVAANGVRGHHGPPLAAPHRAPLKAQRVPESTFWQMPAWRAAP